jgi:hypothetical protein
MKKSGSGKFARTWLALFLAVAVAVGLAPSRASAQSGNTTPASTNKGPVNEELIRKANESYYYLQSQGLKAFQCKIQLSWKQSAGDPSNLEQLNQIRFSVVVDDQGAANVTPFLASGAPIDHSQNEMVSGAQQTVEGFFQSWDNFVFLGIFNASDEEALSSPSEQPDGFHFTGRSGDANMELVLTKDALLTTMKIATPSTIIVMQPKFTKTERGLLLMTSMDADINNGTQALKMQIQYQQVEGFQLPAKADFRVTLPTQVVSLEMSFTDYQLTKR